MARCPNCGQKAKGDFCQWCGYPIMKGGSIRRQRAKREAEERAIIEAEERAKREAEETKKATEEYTGREQHTTTRFVVSICAGIGGAAAIWYKTQEIGWLSYLISATAIGLAVLLWMSIWQRNGGVE